MAVWIASCLISIPPVLILGNEHGTPEQPICEVSQNLGYQLYATLGAFYIPLFVMIVMYYKIYVAAKRVVDAELRDQRPSCSSSMTMRTSNTSSKLNRFYSMRKLTKKSQRQQIKYFDSMGKPFTSSSPSTSSKTAVQLLDKNQNYLQQSSSPNSFYGVGNYHPNSNNQMYQTVNGSTSSSQQQLASNLVNQKLLQPSQIVKSNIKTNNNGNFKNNTGDPTIRGAFGYQLSSQQSSISNYPGHGQQQPQLFKPITSRPTGFGGSLQQQQQQQLSIFQNHNQQQQTKQIQVISNGNGQQQPFSTGSNPFPKLNQHLVNGSSGGGGKQLGYFATGNNFNPHRGYMFSKEENEKLKSVLHFVRMKGK